MIFLNTGIGFVVYGVPVLLIFLTILVSIIEALYLKNYPLLFWTKVKKLLIANFISTLVGLLFILILNVTDGLRIVVEFLTEILKTEKFSLVYSICLSLAVVIPNYAITIIIEFLILKRLLSKELSFKDISMANLISYLTLLLIWIVFLNV